ncbi:ABC transporter ATP-binding protein [bacterium]|nr:ABC transporter ATP-binding protein [bacterium]
MAAPVLRFDEVTMAFPAGEAGPRTVLRDVSFDLPAGRSVALVGRSGSGKSTLLHLAAGVSTPTAGRITLFGTDLTGCGESERTRVRGRHVGLVFQFFHLLPHLSVGENVALPAWVGGEGGRAVQDRARDLLERVGLGARHDDPVSRLSGGEQQRVALCRALLRRPGLVLADEPTGSLDEASGREVMALLHELVRDEGGTLLYVTHSTELAAGADEVWRLHDGRLARAGNAGP